MQTNEKRKEIGIICGLGIGLLVLFLLSMSVGRYGVPLNEVFRFLTGQEIPDLSYRVLRFLRLPRTLLSILIGAALATSGAIYQSAFNNKLVSPDLLGVSSGAGVGACIGILLSLSSPWIGLFAFVSGILAVFLTIGIARAFGNRNHVILLLSGIAVGGLMSSLIGLAKYLADSELKLAEMTYWLLGDISGSTMNDVWFMLPITVLFCGIAIVLSFQLNVVSLGKRDSVSLGVNYLVVIGLLILSATMLTAGAVSVSGTVGWIGLVIPNIVRLIVGSDNRKVVPISMLGGACFMIVTDMLARSLAPNEIPLGVITGILGTPLFLVSIFAKRKEIS